MNRTTLLAAPGALGILLAGCAGSQPHTETQVLHSKEVGTMTVVTESDVDGESTEAGATGTTTAEAPPATACGATTVFFETDSAALDEEASERLERLSECIGEDEKLTIEVSGYADPRGPESYNADLSQQRAKSVRNFLKSKGVDAATYEVRAKGEQSASTSEADWEQERRTEVELVD